MLLVREVKGWYGVYHGERNRWWKALFASEQEAADVMQRILKDWKDRKATAPGHRTMESQDLAYNFVTDIKQVKKYVKKTRK